jgi:hypothetical protein
MPHFEMDSNNFEESYLINANMVTSWLITRMHFDYMEPIVLIAI